MGTSKRSVLDSGDKRVVEQPTSAVLGDIEGSSKVESQDIR